MDFFQTAEAAFLRQPGGSLCERKGKKWWKPKIFVKIAGRVETLWKKWLHIVATLPFNYVLVPDFFPNSSGLGFFSSWRYSYARCYTRTQKLIARPPSLAQGWVLSVTSLILAAGVKTAEKAPIYTAQLEFFSAHQPRFFYYFFLNLVPLFEFFFYFSIFSIFFFWERGKVLRITFGILTTASHLGLFLCF